MRTYREMTHVLLEDDAGSTPLGALDLADGTLEELEGQVRTRLKGMESSLEDEALTVAVKQVMGLVMQNEEIPGALEDKPVIVSAPAVWRDGATLRVERRLEVEF